MMRWIDLIGWPLNTKWPQDYKKFTMNKIKWNQCECVFFWTISQKMNEWNTPNKTKNKKTHTQNSHNTDDPKFWFIDCPIYIVCGVWWCLFLMMMILDEGERESNEKGKGKNAKSQNKKKKVTENRKEKVFNKKKAIM